jgi:RsmE family RNA methyltransferase
MNLILLEPDEVAADGLATLTDARAAHLLRVLEVAAGRTVRIGLIDGPLGTGTVTAAAAGQVTLHCALEEQPPEPPRVDLLLALPRPKVMRRLWAQLAAIGVGHIALTNAARVERHYFDTHVLEPAHFRPLLLEGLQQARDTRLPRVSIHRRFRPLVEDNRDELSDAGCRLVADPNGATAIPAAVGNAAGRVLLAIGPEGGWNGFELDLLARHRFAAVSMGPRTLRTDTACIALLALVHQQLTHHATGNAFARLAP